MLYDLDLYRPSYYYRPRYYSSYSPTYYSSYYNPCYSSWYRYPSSSSSYTSIIRRPYRYSFDYTYDIPEYKLRYYTTYIPRASPVWSETDKYSFVHGLTFRENVENIRYSANKVLEDIRSPRSGSVPRCIQTSNLDTLYPTRKAINRARSEAPSYHNISKCIVY